MHSSTFSSTKGTKRKLSFSLQKFISQPATIRYKTTQLPASLSTSHITQVKWNSFVQPIHKQLSTHRLLFCQKFFLLHLLLKTGCATTEAHGQKTMVAEMTMLHSLSDHKEMMKSRVIRKTSAVEGEMYKVMYKANTFHEKKFSSHS